MICEAIQWKPLQITFICKYSYFTHSVKKKKSGIGAFLIADIVGPGRSDSNKQEKKLPFILSLASQLLKYNKGTRKQLKTQNKYTRALVGDKLPLSCIVLKCYTMNGNK